MKLHAPQAIYLTLALLGLLLAAKYDGKPRQPHSLAASCLGTLVTLWLLWWGGFFS